MDFRYKYVKYSQAEKDFLLSDLKIVGRRKPLGYLPRNTFFEIVNDVDDFFNILKNKRLEVLELNEEDCNIFSGAIFVYDCKALKKILNDNVEILQRANWPTDIFNFILYLKNNLERETELFNVINFVFGNIENT